MFHHTADLELMATDLLVGSFTVNSYQSLKHVKVNTSLLKIASEKIYVVKTLHGNILDTDNKFLLGGTA